jgi:hypothetical protein
MIPSEFRSSRLGVFDGRATWRSSQEGNSSHIMIVGMWKRLEMMTEFQERASLKGG